MAHPKHRTSKVGKTKKRRGRIRVKESLHVQRKDNTNVARRDVDNPFPVMQAQMPRSNGLVLKVKVKHK